jgi:hypothetical protein
MRTAAHARPSSEPRHDGAGLPPIATLGTAFFFVDACGEYVAGFPPGVRDDGFISPGFPSPAENRTKLHNTNPLESLNGEIKRSTGVVGIFFNEDAITRLVGALLLEQNDEFAVQRAAT